MIMAYLKIFCFNTKQKKQWNQIPLLYININIEVYSTTLNFTAFVLR